MRVAALFSGGKDSTYAAYVAQQRGWDVAHLVTVLPADPDSMMLHVPNIRWAPLVAEAFGLPHVLRQAGPGPEAELDAIRDALRDLDVDGLVTGAVASDYQHSRVQRIADDLGIPCFSPLWRQPAEVLLRDYGSAGMHAIFTAVSAEGLDATWLGRKLDASAIHDLLALARTKGVHPIGEGGEYETLVLEAPFFLKRVVVDRSSARWEGTRGVFDIEAAHVEARAGGSTA